VRKHIMQAHRGRCDRSNSACSVASQRTSRNGTLQQSSAGRCGIDAALDVIAHPLLSLWPSLTRPCHAAGIYVSYLLLLGWVVDTPCWERLRGLSGLSSR
jgi:hypothetical protein